MWYHLFVSSQHIISGAAKAEVLEYFTQEISSLLSLVLLTGGHIFIGHNDHPCILEDIRSADCGCCRIERNLVNFSLWLHVELFQLVKNLLQVHAVFCQNENRFVHGSDAYFRFSLSVDS